jgi:hypothetical protein
MTIFIASPLYQKTLTNYLTDTRRLLHDSTGTYWQDAELVDYINEGRNQVVADTGCNRILQSISTIASQETYAYSALPSGLSTIDVLNITLIWGSTRIPLDYMPFTEFNQKLRFFQTLVSRPTVFTIYGQNTVRLGPVPDQIYAMELDTVVIPPTLVNYTDQDILNFPYTSPVPYWAAYKAKEKQQSNDDADRFKKSYKEAIMRAVGSSFTRRIANQGR